MALWSEDDETHMDRALALAGASIGLASPNPQVGCVLVRDGKKLGEGAHSYEQRDHAEIVALQQAATADETVRGATAYVTLEPCSHHGRTGPCADALVAAGIARCMVATLDPNPEVAGLGVARMRAAGIDVSVGLRESEARCLNDAFAFSIIRLRPFVTLKAALSVDGRLAPAPAARPLERAPVWLTGPEARAEVQRLRHGSDAILTGIGTVLADDPLLTDRSGLPRRRALQRIVLDTHLQLPATAKLVQSAQKDLWVFCGPGADPAHQRTLEAHGVRVSRIAAVAGGVDLTEVLEHLHTARILSVLVEAGSALNGALLSRDLVDRAVHFFAATELGPDALPFAAGTAGPFELERRMLSVSKRSFGADVCVSGLLHDPWAVLRHIS